MSVNKAKKITTKTLDFGCTNPKDDSYPDIYDKKYAREQGLSEAVKLFALPQFATQANPANIVGLANLFTEFLLNGSKEQPTATTAPAATQATFG